MSDPFGRLTPPGPLSHLGEMKRRERTPQIDAFEQLTELIGEFQARLDDQHELGAYLANVELPFHLRNVERRGALFLFEGVDDAGQDVLAIQHYGQLSLQLVKVKKLKERPVRVGFVP